MRSSKIELARRRATSDDAVMEAFWTSVRWMRRSPVVALAAGSVLACNRGKSLVGTYGGDWTLGGGFTLLVADGGAASFVGSEPTKEGGVMITTSDGKSFTMNIELPAMKCTLTAHLDDDGETLVVDGPGTNSPLVYRDVPSGQGPPWQHCRVRALGFEGEVQLSGKARSPSRDAIWLNLWIHPRINGDVRDVSPGAGARMEFKGRKHRQVGAR